MDNFKVSVMLPGSEEEKEYQRQIEQQKAAARHSKIDWSGSSKDAIAAQFKAAVAASHELDAERQRQNENERRIADGTLKPFEVDGHPVHRVDFIVMPDGVKVIKINHDNNQGMDVRLSVEVKAVDLVNSRRWLEENGYIVRQWNDTAGKVIGMRAWFGRLWPIRTKHEVITERTRLSNQRARGTNQVDTSTVDLAYDV